MILSIVITTFNRAAVLKTLLQSLEKQSDPDFQVVVAIDDSTDNTEDMLKNLRTSYPLKWVNTHCSEYGLAVARNMGILASGGDAVVILDDDSFPELSFVEAHKNSVRQGAITGGPRNPSSHADKRMVWKMKELDKLPRGTPMSIEQLKQDWPNAYLIENNICMFKQDWIDIGLFSERIKMYGFIGQEFFARADYLDFQFQYNPEAIITHHGQLEGDNGLGRTRKNRQIMLSEILRPSLMSSKHYKSQVEWASEMVNSQAVNFKFPPYLFSAVCFFPLRFLKAKVIYFIKTVRRLWLK